MKTATSEKHYQHTLSTSVSGSPSLSAINCSTSAAAAAIVVLGQKVFADTKMEPTTHVNLIEEIDEKDPLALDTSTELQTNILEKQELQSHSNKEVLQYPTTSAAAGLNKQHLRRYIPRIIVKPIPPEKSQATVVVATSTAGTTTISVPTTVYNTSISNNPNSTNVIFTVNNSATSTNNIEYNSNSSNRISPSSLSGRSASSRRIQQQQQAKAAAAATKTNLDSSISTGAVSKSVTTQASTMREVLASIPGFTVKPRRRSSKKISTAAQIEQTKDGKIDLETPDSILASTNLRALLNKTTLSTLPLLYQYKLIQLLPSVDREAIEAEQLSTQQTSLESSNNIPTEAIRLSSSSLNNEFFARACLEWRERLAEGEFTPENQMKLRAEAERERSKLDPWKLKHFEPFWGERSTQRCTVNKDKNLKQENKPLESLNSISSNSNINIIKKEEEAAATSFTVLDSQRQSEFKNDVTDTTISKATTSNSDTIKTTTIETYKSDSCHGDNLGENASGKILLRVKSEKISTVTSSAKDDVLNTNTTLQVSSSTLTCDKLTENDNTKKSLPSSTSLYEGNERKQTHSTSNFNSSETSSSLDSKEYNADIIAGTSELKKRGLKRPTSTDSANGSSSTESVTAIENFYETDCIIESNNKQMKIEYPTTELLLNKNTTNSAVLESTTSISIQTTSNKDHDIVFSSQNHHQLVEVPSTSKIAEQNEQLLQYFATNNATNISQVTFENSIVKSTCDKITNSAATTSNLAAMENFTTPSKDVLNIMDSNLQIENLICEDVVEINDTVPVIDSVVDDENVVENIIAVDEDAELIEQKFADAESYVLESGEVSTDSSGDGNCSTDMTSTETLTVNKTHENALLYSGSFDRVLASQDCDNPYKSKNPLVSTSILTTTTTSSSSSTSSLSMPSSSKSPLSSSSTGISALTFTATPTAVMSATIMPDHVQSIIGTVPTTAAAATHELSMKMQQEKYFSAVTSPPITNPQEIIQTAASHNNISDIFHHVQHDWNFGEMKIQQHNQNEQKCALNTNDLHNVIQLKQSSENILANERHLINFGVFDSNINSGVDVAAIDDIITSASTANSSNDDGTGDGDMDAELTATDVENSAEIIAELDDDDLDNTEDITDGGVSLASNVVLDEMGAIIADVDESIDENESAVHKIVNKLQQQHQQFLQVQQQQLQFEPNHQQQQHHLRQHRIVDLEETQHHGQAITAPFLQQIDYVNDLSTDVLCDVPLSAAEMEVSSTVVTNSSNSNDSLNSGLNMCSSTTSNGSSSLSVISGNLQQHFQPNSTPAATQRQILVDPNGQIIGNFLVEHQQQTQQQQQQQLIQQTAHFPFQISQQESQDQRQHKLNHSSTAATTAMHSMLRGNKLQFEMNSSTQQQAQHFITTAQQQPQQQEQQQFVMQQHQQPQQQEQRNFLTHSNINNILSATTASQFHHQQQQQQQQQISLQQQHLHNLQQQHMQTLQQLQQQSLQTHQPIDTTGSSSHHHPTTTKYISKQLNIISMPTRPSNETVPITALPQAPNASTSSYTVPALPATSGATIPVFSNNLTATTNSSNVNALKGLALSAGIQSNAKVRTNAKAPTAGKVRKAAANKLPPGAVNLERSYQICQAVIQNSPNRENLKAQLRPPSAILSQQQQQQQHSHQHQIMTTTSPLNIGSSSIPSASSNIIKQDEIITNALPPNVMGVGRPGVYKVIGPRMGYPRKKFVQRKQSPTLIRHVFAATQNASHTNTVTGTTTGQQVTIMPQPNTHLAHQQIQQQQHHDLHQNGNRQYLLVHRANVGAADNQAPRASSAPPMPQNQLHGINGMSITGRGRPASVDVDTSNSLHDTQHGIGLGNANTTSTAVNIVRRNIAAANMTYVDSLPANSSASYVDGNNYIVAAVTTASGVVASPTINVTSSVNHNSGGITAGGMGANSIKTSSNVGNSTNCACSLNAMVICQQCGAFCHDDCASSKLCVSCVIR